MLNKLYVKEHVKNALLEDIGYGDITTENLAEESDFLKGSLDTRSDGILCGCDVFKTVFELLSDKIEIKFYFKDGDEIKKGDKIADISGPAKELLMGERVALNYIQRMSGIATETHKYQNAIKPYSAKIVDTRKTTPNFRPFEKYSVKVGGGALHRFNLADCAMIKDNHIRLAGSITNAVTKLRKNLSQQIFLQNNISIIILCCATLFPLILMNLEKNGGRFKHSIGILYLMYIEKKKKMKLNIIWINFVNYLYGVKWKFNGLKF